MHNETCCFSFAEVNEIEHRGRESESVSELFDAYGGAYQRKVFRLPHSQHTILEHAGKA